MNQTGLNILSPADAVKESLIYQAFIKAHSYFDQGMVEASEQPTVPLKPDTFAVNCVLFKILELLTGFQSQFIDQNAENYYSFGSSWLVDASEIKKIYLFI